jgi:flagellar biosynthesis component FlhA
MDLIATANRYKSKVDFAIAALNMKRGALKQVAKSENISPDLLKKYLRLLNLPSEVQANVSAGRIKLVEAILIERLPADRQIEISEYYLNRKISRKRLTEIVNGILQGSPEQTSLTNIDVNIRKELERLIESLGFIVDDKLTDDSIAVIKSWDEDLVKHLFLVKNSVDIKDYNLDISIPTPSRLNSQGIKITLTLSGVPQKDQIATLICQLFRRVETLRTKLSNSKKKPLI